MLVCPSLALNCKDRPIRTMGVMDGRYFVWEPKPWGAPNNETIDNAQYEIGVGSLHETTGRAGDFIPLVDGLSFDKVMAVLPVTFQGADHCQTSLSWRRVTDDVVVISHRFDDCPDNDGHEHQLYVSRTKGFLGYTYIGVSEGEVTVEHYKGGLATYITEQLLNTDCMMDKEFGSPITWVRPMLAFPANLSLYFADWLKFPGVEDYYLAWIGILDSTKGFKYIHLQSVSEDRKSGVTHNGNVVKLLTAFKGKRDALEKDEGFEFGWSEVNGLIR